MVRELFNSASFKFSKKIPKLNLKTFKIRSVKKRAEAEDSANSRPDDCQHRLVIFLRSLSMLKSQNMIFKIPNRIGRSVAAFGLAAGGDQQNRCHWESCEFSVWKVFPLHLNEKLRCLFRFEESSLSVDAVKFQTKTVRYQVSFMNYTNSDNSSQTRTDPPPCLLICETGAPLANSENIPHTQTHENVWRFWNFNFENSQQEPDCMKRISKTGSGYSFSIWNFKIVPRLLLNSL